MNIVVGSGKSRSSFIVPHRSTVSRDTFDRMNEDLKAFIVRPSTFKGHSSSV